MKSKCLIITKKSISIVGLTLLTVMLSSQATLATAMTSMDETLKDAQQYFQDKASTYDEDNAYKSVTNTTSDVTPTPIPKIDPQVSGDVAVKNGYVNIDKGTSIYYFANKRYTSRIFKISINTNAKYSGLVKDVLKHFGTEAMYPSAGRVYMMESYYDSYTTFNASANKKFLAGIADKYQLCDTEDSNTTKSRIVLAVFYGCYNNNDGTVIYNKKNDARISRKEFYALMCKFTQGTDTSWVYDSGLGLDSPWEQKYEFDQRDYWDPKWIFEGAPILREAGRIYAPYVRWLDTAPISVTAAKADLNSNIKRVEIIYTIAKMYGNSAAEEYNGQSITKYCSDIKSSQIVTWKQISKMFPEDPKNREYAEIEIYKYCLKNKLLLDYWQPYIIAAIKKGIITPNAKNELGLFNNVTYNQAINYLCNFDIPE